MKTHNPERAGMSLVELAVVVAILFLVITGVTVVGNASDRAYRTGATVAQLEAQTAAATSRIVNELATAGINTFTTQTQTVLEYSKAVGLDGDTVQWTPPRRLALELDPGEIDDGLDNNGNGLVDEGRVVLIENLGQPDERELVLTRWVPELAAGETLNGIDDDGNGLVDEPGFSVERIGETFIVRLSLQRRDAAGRLLSRSATTSTRIRNRDLSGEGS